MSVNCRTPPSRRFDPTGNRFGAASCRSDPSGSDLDPPYSVLIKKRDLATASRFRSHEAQSFLASKNQATTLAIPSRPRVTIQFQLNRDDVFKLHKERERYVAPLGSRAMPQEVLHRRKPCKQSPSISTRTAF